MDGPNIAEGQSPERGRGEPLLATVADAVPAIVLVFDRRGQLRFVNREAHDACERADAAIRDPVFLLGSDDPGGVIERIRRGAQPSPFQSTWRTAGGELRFLEWTWRRAAIEGDGDVLLCTGVDVTARERSEEAHQAQVHLLQTLLDTLPNPLFYKTVDGLYRGCNKAFEEMLGIPREQIVGKTVYELSPRSLADIYYAKDRELFEHPGVQVYEASVQYASGELRDVIYYKATYDDLDGNVAGLVGIFLDITDRKRAERALAEARDALEARVVERTAELERQKDRAEAADRAKTEFINIASHELRTPLTSLRLTVHQLAQSAAASEPIQPLHLGRIDRQVGRLARMVNELLDISRIERGTLSLHVRRTDLRALVEDTVEELRGIAGTHRIATSLPAEPVWIEADADRLRQVLSNLIDNALKYTPPDSPVAVALSQLPGHVRISVTDQGPGIPPEATAQLFTPFARLHSPHHQEGLGLGLYISQEIVRRHGGAIWLESASGRGCTAYVELPEDGAGSSR